MKRQPVKGSTVHGHCPACKQERPALNFKRTLMRRYLLKVFSWLSCLSKWGVGPFKRGSHLSAQGQQSWSGQSHCASVIIKNWGDSVHNTHSICVLSTTVMSLFIAVYTLVFNCYAYIKKTTKKKTWDMFLKYVGQSVERTDPIWRSHLADFRETVNNSVKAFNPTTSRK